MNPTNDLLMDLFDYLVLLKLEAAFQKSGMLNQHFILLDANSFNVMFTYIVYCSRY